MSLAVVNKKKKETEAAEPRPIYTCNRCGHVWAKRDWKKVKHAPGTCPKCKSALWDVPKGQ